MTAMEMEMQVMLAALDGKHGKSIGLTPGGLIKIETWKVAKTSSKASQKLRTIGANSYAGKTPIEAFIDTINAEKSGFALRSVIDPRVRLVDRATWIEFAINIHDSARRLLLHEMLTLDTSLAPDLCMTSIGADTLLLPRWQKGFIVLSNKGMYGVLDSRTDHDTMTLVEVALSDLGGKTQSPLDREGLSDLRRSIKRNRVSATIRRVGEKAKIFVMPIQFSGRTAVW